MRDGIIFFDGEYRSGNQITELCVVGLHGDILLHCKKVHTLPPEERRTLFGQLASLLNRHYTLACGIEFDLAQLDHAYRELQLQRRVQPHFVNIQDIEMAHRGEKSSLSLKRFAERYHLEPEGSWHSALSDAQLVRAAFLHQAASYGFDAECPQPMLDALHQWSQRVQAVIRRRQSRKKKRHSIRQRLRRKTGATGLRLRALVAARRIRGIRGAACLGAMLEQILRMPQIAERSETT